MLLAVVAVEKRNRDQVCRRWLDVTVFQTLGLVVLDELELIEWA